MVEAASVESIAALFELRKLLHKKQRIAGYLRNKASSKVVSPVLQQPIDLGAQVHAARQRVDHLRNRRDALKRELQRRAREHCDTRLEMARRLRIMREQLFQLFRKSAPLTKPALEYQRLQARKLTLSQRALTVLQKRLIRQLSTEVFGLARNGNSSISIGNLTYNNASFTASTAVALATDAVNRTAAVGYICMIVEAFCRIVNAPATSYRINHVHRTITDTTTNETYSLVGDSRALLHVNHWIATVLWYRGIVVANLDTLIANMLRLVAFEAASGPGPHDFSRLYIGNGSNNGNASNNGNGGSSKTVSPNSQRQRVKSLVRIQPHPQAPRLPSVVEELEENWKLL